MKPKTLKQMAEDLNKFYKKNGHSSQITILGRKVLCIDYSIPVERKEYGIAPIWVGEWTAKTLRHQHALMSKNLIH